MKEQVKNGNVLKTFFCLKEQENADVWQRAIVICSTECLGLPEAVHNGEKCLPAMNHGRRYILLLLQRRATAERVSAKVIYYHT